jgi:hypothetical protein
VLTECRAGSGNFLHRLSHLAQLFGEPLAVRLSNQADDINQRLRARKSLLVYRAHSKHVDLPLCPPRCLGSFRSRYGFVPSNLRGRIRVGKPTQLKLAELLGRRTIVRRRISLGNEPLILRQHRTTMKPQAGDLISIKGHVHLLRCCLLLLDRGHLLGPPTSARRLGEQPTGVVRQRTTFPLGALLEDTAKAIINP